MNEKSADLEQELINEPQIDTEREALLYGMKPDEYYTREEIDEYFYDKVDIDNNFYDKEEVDQQYNNFKNALNELENNTNNHFIEQEEHFNLEIEEQIQNANLYTDNKISEIPLVGEGALLGESTLIKAINIVIKNNGVPCMVNWNETTYFLKVPTIPTKNGSYSFSLATVSLIAKTSQPQNGILKLRDSKITYSNGSFTFTDGIVTSAKLNGASTGTEYPVLTTSYTSDTIYFIPTMKSQPVSKGYLDDTIASERTITDEALETLANDIPNLMTIKFNGYYPDFISTNIRDKAIKTVMSGGVVLGITKQYTQNNMYNSQTGATLWRLVSPYPSSGASTARLEWRPLNAVYGRIISTTDCTMKGATYYYTKEYAYSIYLNEDGTWDETRNVSSSSYSSPQWKKLEDNMDVEDFKTITTYRGTNDVYYKPTYKSQPTSKGYVDDAIATAISTAITDALGGSY